MFFKKNIIFEYGFVLAGINQSLRRGLGFQCKVLMFLAETAVSSLSGVSSQSRHVRHENCMVGVTG
jgi:hypothetical protein